MHNYLIRFHKGTPKESTCILEIHCKATSDIPACMYRDVLEKELKDKLDFDFTICQREGYLPEDVQ